MIPNLEFPRLFLPTTFLLHWKMYRNDMGNILAMATHFVSSQIKFKIGICFFKLVVQIRFCVDPITSNLFIKNVLEVDQLVQ